MACGDTGLPVGLVRMVHGAAPPFGVGTGTLLSGSAAAFRRIVVRAAPPTRRLHAVWRTGAARRRAIRETVRMLQELRPSIAPDG